MLRDHKYSTKFSWAVKSRDKKEKKKSIHKM